MDKIKEAFEKVREDIEFLNQEISSLQENMFEIKNLINNLTEEIHENQSFNTPTHPTHIPTHPTHIPTHPTHNLSLNDLKEQNMPCSTGNQGVPTDRQTDRQTDQHIEKEGFFLQNHIEKASEILDSLDSLKKEVRLKFKRLTEQEWLIFSTLYQLEEEAGNVDYRLLSKRLNLTESSIRDYIGRLIKKGIPVDKKRINNKNIVLSVSSNLKKIASLNTILQLREI